MEKQWIGCASDNFRIGRPAGLRPEIIVLHRIEGTLRDAAARFSKVGAALSAHYAVGKRGEVHQYVAEADTAYHAGIVINPSAELVLGRPNVNPNFYSVGIEHEGLAGESWPQLQVESSAALIGEIASRWQIPLDVSHVLGHSAIRASVNCPGANCDIADLLVRARSAAGNARALKEQRVQTLANVNLRQGPSRLAQIVRVLAAKTELMVVGFVEGERVSGNSFWYVNEADQYLWAGATSRPHPTESAGSVGDDLVVSTDPMEISPGGVAPSQSPHDAKIRIDRTTLPLPSKEYFAVPTRKDLIVLHFTAGLSARSAVDTWRSKPEHVATAYVVDGDGTIYEVFDPSFWAYHLGIKGTSVHDKRSVGIEIANVGPLKQSPGNQRALNWWPAEFRRQYCLLDEEEKYRKVNYRGIDYFATFSAAQYSAVAKLVQHLCDRLSIPRIVPGKDKRPDFDLPFYSSYKGIATHANFRRDKWDIGPCYDWESLGI
jgi:N-acetyl-anhydromuramyl-L-alanine amidase AmpD